MNDKTVIKQVKVTYYPSAKAFEKQTKTTEEQKTKQNITKKKKQVEVLDPEKKIKN